MPDTGGVYVHVQGCLKRANILQSKEKKTNLTLKCFFFAGLWCWLEVYKAQAAIETKKRYMKQNIYRWEFMSKDH